jgi:hypothetical protein
MFGPLSAITMAVFSFSLANISLMIAEKGQNMYEACCMIVCIFVLNYYAVVGINIVKKPDWQFL